ncbi:MAG: hypothetical protein M3Q10_01340 [Chloroflexota bacterium]|nr:hypothetical protein [Chloroflexota bacterium]
MDDVDIRGLDNDALIIRLHFAVNHLSRWLSPIHNQGRLDRSPTRAEPAAKALVVRLRNEESRVYPQLHAIATRNLPDLDALPPPRRTEVEERFDQTATALELMAEFRRLRQSTCALLRSLPDTAWKRRGISRKEHDWSVRSLAEHLAEHDREVLSTLDRVLTRGGARTDVTSASRVGVDELLRLTPVSKP